MYLTYQVIGNKNKYNIMSKLNINRNTFLEKEELVNFQSFFASNLLMNLLLNTSYSFGIVTNNPLKINSGYETADSEKEYNDPFTVKQGSVQGTVQILPGLALTSSGKIINIGLEDNFTIPNDSKYYWIKIGYTTRNWEEGYVSINVKGVVSGTVNFSGKVRGQSSSTPVCIRFEKLDGSIPLNNGIYQVVNMIDAQNLTLSSATSFVNESNLRAIIIGTLPLGGLITSDQKNGLYTYDHYTISLVAETEVDTPPTKENDEYFIARVRNTNGSLSIDNTKKTEYWTLGNIIGLTKKE